MSINSYSAIPIPQSPFTDDKGMITHMWYLFLSNLASQVAPYTRQVVTNGFSFIVPTGVKNVILDPAGVLASGTLTMPPNVTNGQEIVFTSSNTITSCTFAANTGQTMVNAPTTLTAGNSVSFIFSAQSQTWYKK